MTLKTKIILKQKNDSAEIPVKNITATLSWTASVDLDLYAFYRIKQTVKPRGGFLGFGGVKPGKEGKVFFMSRGNLKEFPWMQLDKDEGIGDRGGSNKENLRITNLDEIEHVLIVANIFNKPNANFAKYDGRVTVKDDSGGSFEVPLTASSGGNWCIIAHIDNSKATGAKLINVNQVQSTEPSIAQFLK